MPISLDTVQEWFMEDIDWNARNIPMVNREKLEQLVYRPYREQVLQATLINPDKEWLIPYRIAEEVTLQAGKMGRISSSHHARTKTLTSEDGSRKWTLHATKTIPGIWSDEVGIVVVRLHLNGEDKGLIAITSDSDSWDASGESLIEVYRTVEIGGEWVNLNERIGQVAEEVGKAKLLAEIERHIEALNEAKTVINEYSENNW